MLNIRLSDKLDRELSEEAVRSSRSRSEIARQALTLYLRVQRRRRYIERLELAAQRLVEAEACALADEALPLGGEAFAIAEGAQDYALDRDKWWK